MFRNFGAQHRLVEICVWIYQLYRLLKISSCPLSIVSRGQLSVQKIAAATKTAIYMGDKL
jgi:hypothetical protein